MKVNKSEMIRGYLREYPGVRTRDVIAHFSGQGVVMSPQLVASVRGREFGSAKKVEDVRLSEVRAVRDFVQKSELDEEVAVGILKSFGDLVESFGSLGRFRRVLAEYVRFEGGEGGKGVDPEPEHEDHEEDTGSGAYEDGGSSYIDVNEDDD